MNKYILLILLALQMFAAFAARPVTDTFKNSKSNRNGRIHNQPFSFIGFSAGVNNPAGILGFDFDIPIKQYISLGTGLGFSSWGNKIHAEGKYYLKPNQIGWALTGGISYNSGVSDFQANLQTENFGKEKVTINMHPLSTLFLGVFHYWRLGHGANRCFLQLGWDVPIKQAHFVQTTGDPLSDSSKRYLQHREPGGPVIGFGCSFGLHH